jgi:thiol-disulfide isomerase/thioredoxin
MTVMMRRDAGRTAYCLLLAISILQLPIQQAQAEYLHKYPFLYATIENANASFPVIEHLSREFRRDFHLSSETSNNKQNGSDEGDDDRPDFLYNHEGQGYRIVEFYVHWCTTCKLFASVYRSFAIKIREMAAHQGIQNNIQIYAISCSPNRKLCVDQNVKGFPKIRLYKPGDSEFVELVNHHHLHPLRVLEALGIDSDGIESLDDTDEDWNVNSEMAKLAQDGGSSPPSYWVQLVAFITGKGDVRDINNTMERGKYPRRTREDLKSDIYLSFDYALRNEIYRSPGGLSETQQQVLRDWLNLLIHSLPSSWEIHKLLQELMNNFIYIVKSEDYLMALLDEYPAPVQAWSPSCSYGVPDEGYTCGLWELFHTATVGVVEYNKATFDPSQLLVTETTARTIRDYVDHFFGCLTCRENFLEMFDKCSFNRCDRLADYPIEDENDWIELPLWMHETHNHVNVRLLQEKAIRGQKGVTSIDIANAQWPSRIQCAACWRDDVDLKTPDEIPWRVDKLFKFLRLEYGSRDAFTADLRRELNPEPEAPASNTASTYQSIVLEQSNSKKTVLRFNPDAPLLIQLSHASMFVVCVVLLNAAVSARKQRQLKLKVC